MQKELIEWLLEIEILVYKEDKLQFKDEQSKEWYIVHKYLQQKKLHKVNDIPFETYLNCPYCDIMLFDAEIEDDNNGGYIKELVTLEQASFQFIKHCPSCGQSVY